MVGCTLMRAKPIAALAACELASLASPRFVTQPIVTAMDISMA